MASENIKDLYGSALIENEYLKDQLKKANSYKLKYLTARQEIMEHLGRIEQLEDRTFWQRLWNKG